MPLKEKKGVLIITDVFKLMAGSERNITRLLACIDKERFELSVACFISGKLARDMRDRGFPVYDLQRGGIYTVHGFKNLVFLRKLICEKQISLIVTYHEGADFYGLVLSRLCSIPVISSRRDMGFNTRSHHEIAYKLLGRFYDSVITVCDAVKNEVVKRGWFPPGKINTIYNGVDLERFDGTSCVKTLRTAMGIKHDRSVVGMIANIRRIKGVQFFIEAASIIAKRGAPVEFLVIGDDMNEAGYTEAEMKALARNLNVHENLRFLGRRTDVAELISLFDIAVVSSLSEGFSNAILEYMAASKPVVATDVGGNSEAVVHCETGLLVPPGNANALADAIWTLLEKKEMALAFGKAGRRRVEQKFTLRKMIDHYEELFDRVITENRCDSKECMNPKHMSMAEKSRR
jgi:glycosyltransferase involved in cell wall biosynthesis